MSEIVRTQRRMLKKDNILAKLDGSLVLWEHKFIKRKILLTFTGGEIYISTDFSGTFYVL